MAGRRPGREPKGGSRIPVRFPEDQLQQYRQQAEDAGLSLSDWIANELARAKGLPEPWPTSRNTEGQLPLEMAA